MSVLDQPNLFRRSFIAVAGSAVATAKVHNLRKRGFTPRHQDKTQTPLPEQRSLSGGLREGLGIVDALDTEALSD